MKAPPARNAEGTHQITEIIGQTEGDSVMLPMHPYAYEPHHRGATFDDANDPLDSKECSPTASRVYPVLRLYADTDSPVAKTVAHLGISRRTVYRAIEELCAAGLVVKPTGYTFPEMAQCDIQPMAQCAILGGTEPISAPLSPATTVLSTSTHLPIPTTNMGQQTKGEAEQIVERLVKYRHIYYRSYRKREFVLWDKTRVVWMKSASILLEVDGLDLTEILTVMDYAFSVEKWRPRIKAVYDLRQHYDTLLMAYRRSQVDDIPHEPWSS